MIKIIWPKGSKFAICLSHDVDRIKKTYQCITHFIKSGDIHHIKDLFEGENPYWNFEKIMALESKYDVRSTFFFLNESKKFNLFKPREWKLTLGNYNIKDEKIVNIIGKLYEGGWEIAVHGSYESYMNRELLFKEKTELEDIVGDEIVGIRQHYLNLEIPLTWKFQKYAGFKYDSSFGYRYRIGFRDNKFLPFIPFNDYFLVIPLVIMDTALFTQYKNYRDALYASMKILDLAERKNALLCVNWHNRVFYEKDFPGWSKVYETIIKEGKRRNAFFGRCRDIYEWIIKEKNY